VTASFATVFVEAFTLLGIFKTLIVSFPFTRYQIRHEVIVISRPLQILNKKLSRA
jgi:hypothetical protein